MKRTLIASAIVTALSLLTTPSFANDAETAQQLVEQMESPISIEQVDALFAENPTLVLPLLEQLLTDNSVEVESLIASAFNADPEQAQAIADLARDFGMQNEDITALAILNNIDPTLIAEAPAAGIATAQTAAISAPTAPAVGGGGGGGNSVVSPN